jgi:hypothetical protein
MDLAATAADRSVALSWRTSPDAETVGVMRTPGIGFETATHVFAGPGTSFVDGQVENGVRYAYEVRARDAAGNVGAATVTATPLAPAATFSLVESAGGAEPAAGLAGGGVAQPVTVDDDLDLHLIAPAARAVFRTGQRPLLRWTPVPGASYYNLQLFRRGKILTAWPSKPQHRLKLRWRYRGKRYRLSPGEYQWIVWPGFGPRSKADYGRRIGRRSFVVRAASR